MSSVNPTLRRARRSFPSVLVGGGLLSVGLLGGCVFELASSQVATPAGPVIQRVESGALSPPASRGTRVIVLQVPPFPQQESAPAAPSSRHVWLAGYWTRRNDRYEWLAGHWEQPPGASSLWIRPRWVRTGTAYRFYEGYWD